MSTTSIQDKSLFQNKVKKLASLAAKSETMKRYMDGSLDKWEEFFSFWDEDGVDAFILVLEEEKNLLDEAEKETARKLQVNETRLKQKLQKITVDASNLTNKDNG